MPDTVGLAGHRAARERLEADYRRIPAGAAGAAGQADLQPVPAPRGASTCPASTSAASTASSRSTREARTADVQGMCTYERPRRRDPAARADARSSSRSCAPSPSAGRSPGSASSRRRFRNGLPHESVLEMDILTGAGEVVTARPDNEHADLFDAFPNSYGSLGYATRLRIELEPVRRVRRAAARPLRRRRRCWPRPSPTIVETRAATTASRSTSSTASSSQPEESYLTLAAGPTTRAAALGQRLHRPADLLPLDPAAAGRPTC